MFVIAKKAEQRLLKELKRISREESYQKCFHIRFSDKTEYDREVIFENFLRLLNEMPHSYMAQVYICDDRDIFILLQGFMQRQFNEILKSLAESTNTPDLYAKADVFETGRDMDTLVNKCRAKAEILERKIEKQEEAKRKEESEKTTLRVLADLDPAQINVLPRERKKRHDALVLVVDDDQLSRTLAGNVISKDYRICYAKNGQQALETYAEKAPDVVFLDIGMPDIDGHQVLECLFQMDPEAYVIMFSGRKDKNNIMKAIETGAQGFVGKPFTRDKLFEYIGKSPHVRDKESGKPRAQVARKASSR